MTRVRNTTPTKQPVLTVSVELFIDSKLGRSPRALTQQTALLRKEADGDACRRGFPSAAAESRASGPRFACQARFANPRGRAGKPPCPKCDTPGPSDSRPSGL